MENIFEIPTDCYVLWDIENCSIPKFTYVSEVKNSIDDLKREHNLNIKEVKIVGSNKNFRYNLEKEFEMSEFDYYIPSNTKSSSDIEIVTLAMDIIYKAEKCVIMLISGDRDYKTLLKKIREKDHKSILVHLNNSEADFVNLADHSVTWDKFLKTANPTSYPSPPPKTRTKRQREYSGSSSWTNDSGYSSDSNKCDSNMALVNLVTHCSASKFKRVKTFHFSNSKFVKLGDIVKVEDKLDNKNSYNYGKVLRVVKNPEFHPLENIIEIINKKNEYDSYLEKMRLDIVLTHKCRDIALLYSAKFEVLHAEIHGSVSGVLVIYAGVNDLKFEAFLRDILIREYETKIVRFQTLSSPVL